MVNFPVRVKAEEACAASLNLPISRKKANKICKKLRNRKVSEATKILNQIKAGKRTIGGKRWPTVCEHFMQLLKSVKANAKNKGLPDRLRIKLLVAERGGRRAGQRRRRRRRAEQAFGQELKSTNLKVIVSGS